MKKDDKFIDIISEEINEKFEGEIEDSYKRQKESINKRKEILRKIKDIINKFGEATSEGGIYWNDETEIYSEEFEETVCINKHPLDIIAEEILKLFINDKK